MFRLVRIKQSQAFRLSSSSSSRSLSSLPLNRPQQSQLAGRRPVRFTPLPASQPAHASGRWQSTDTTQKPTEDATTSTPAQESEAPQPTEEDVAKKELEAKTREIIDLKDKYLRSVAEFRNLQERSKREMDSARQFAIQRFAGDLIESIDNLDRALEAVPVESLSPAQESPEQNAAAGSHHRDLMNLHSGLKMTESILMGTLKKHGLEKFDPVADGRKFDPRLDEATFMTKVEGKDDGDAIHTQSKGFTLHGRVLRAAKVGVVKNS